MIYEKYHSFYSNANITLLIIILLISTMFYYLETKVKHTYVYMCMFLYDVYVCCECLNKKCFPMYSRNLNTLSPVDGTV